MHGEEHQIVVNGRSSEGIQIVASVAGAVVGALLSAMTKNVAALVVKVLQRFGPSNSLHRDIGYMGRELEMIVAQEQHLVTRDLSPVEMKFMEQMRDLAQDIEDCLDRILRSSSEGEAEGLRIQRRIKKVVGDAISSRQVASEVKELRVRLKEAEKRKDKYNVDGSRSAGTSTNTATTTNSPANVDPVGIDKPKRDILEFLNDVEDKADQLKVISVVGFAGTGKSTLAKAVYDCPDIISRFPSRAWVSASEYRGNNTGFHKALREKLRPEPQPETDNAQLLEDIKMCLIKTRYLIVFDDIEREQWESIIPILKTTGSRLIVTTRIQTLAQLYCNDGDPGYVYNMRSLDEKHSEELLEALLDRTLPGLEHTSALIVKNCYGHPLTLLSMANYLKGKTEFTENDCITFFNDLGSHMADPKSPFRNLQQILLNYYRSLPGSPADLKTCLLYMCVFPNGHPIRRSNLMRRWIAEGYVCDPDPCKALLDADESLNGLIDRHIIQSIDPCKNAKVKTCRAHGIMHEFILRMSKSANFVTSVRDPNRGKYRHLFMKDHRQVPAIENKLRAHSLTICGSAGEAALDFAKCEFLRVLDLEECSDLKDHHMEGIHKLWHLKYLSLGGTITRLPSKIKKLHCLETLDMRKASRIEELILPVEVLKLPHLAHLLGKFKLGKRKRKWKISELGKFLPKECNLQTLAGFVTDGNPGFPLLMVRMKRLRKVKIWCNDEELDTTGIKKFIEHELDTGIGVRSLSLHLMSSSENILHSLENCGLGYLSSLKLHGALSGLTKFVTSLCSLTELCLSSTNDLVSDQISSLCLLIHLVYLKLVNVSLGGFTIEKGHFPRLLRLCLVQSTVTIALPTIDEGALRNLISLRLLNKDLGDLSGIEISRHGHLQEVALDSEISEEAKLYWEDAAKKHPKRPRVLYLKRVDPDETGSMVKYVAPTPAPETNCSAMQEEGQIPGAVQQISVEEHSSAL